MTTFKGGKCGISGETICRGAHVAYFRDKGLCLAPHIEALIAKEQRDAKPKCGCGRPVDDERQGCCLLCAWKAELWFDVEYCDLTREHAPVPADPATNP